MGKRETLAALAKRCLDKADGLSKFGHEDTVLAEAALRDAAAEFTAQAEAKCYECGGGLVTVCGPCNGITLLSAEDWAEFERVMKNPGEPTEAMKQAKADHAEWVKQQNTKLIPPETRPERSK